MAELDITTLRSPTYPKVRSGIFTARSHASQEKKRQTFPVSNASTKNSWWFFKSKLVTAGLAWNSYPMAPCVNSGYSVSFDLLKSSWHLLLCFLR